LSNIVECVVSQVLKAGGGAPGRFPLSTEVTDVRILAML